MFSEIKHYTLSPFHLMDDPDQFTLQINSNMDPQHNNNDHTNPSTENFDSPNVTCHQLFMPLSGRHQRDDCSLPFMFLPDGTTTDEHQDFNFNTDDHQADSFYDPLTCFGTTTDHTVKIKSGDERLGNSDRNRQNFTAGCGGRKRFKNSETKVAKPREVVHVRARRGEATDSHSLAERLRREKINRKLRSLQELVPGCYKTMGMSVMLEVTINYIRSLQNQIEFLSMKLTAASMFYDFNSTEMDDLDSMKGALNGYEAQVMDAMGGEGYGNILQFQSTWPL